MVTVGVRTPDIENHEELSDQPGAYSNQASKEPPDALSYEGHALVTLDSRGCSSTPKPLECFRELQKQGSWVLGGSMYGEMMRSCRGKL